MWHICEKLFDNDRQTILFDFSRNEAIIQGHIDQETKCDTPRPQDVSIHIPNLGFLPQII